MSTNPDDMRDDIDANTERLDHWDRPMVADIIAVLDRAAQLGAKVTIEYTRAGELEKLTATMVAPEVRCGSRMTDPIQIGGVDRFVTCDRIGCTGAHRWESNPGGGGPSVSWVDGDPPPNGGA